VAPVVTVVHTSFLVVDSLTELFREIAPDVELRHRVEDGLLRDVIAEGGVTPALKERLLAHFHSAAADGCDVVFSQCSSVGGVADEAAALIDVPVVKIDTPMAEHACALGKRIGIVATLGTTLVPTRELVEQTARKHGVEVEIESLLVEGAFAQLEAGDRAAHDDAVLDAIRSLIARVDVVVCAQGSMAAVVPRLGETPVPVLTSPRLGVQRAVDVARCESARKSARS
jgi:aspartate/glutamate racemase